MELKTTIIPEKIIIEIYKKFWGTSNAVNCRLAELAKSLLAIRLK